MDFMPREASIIRTLVELADNLVEEYDVVDVLCNLSDRCVETLNVDSAGVMLASPSGDLQVVASSSDAMRSLELFELQAKEGPCLDAFRSGQPILNHELSQADIRWPRFTQRALDDGFHSVHALPMRLRGRTIGALNLFRISQGSLTTNDVLAAQGLADVATIAIIQHRASMEAYELNDQLNQALNSRIIIEQAKGKIAESAKVDLDQAFLLLRNHARNHNLGLTDLCRYVANGTISSVTIDQFTPPTPRK
jgi:GAF domain-containing protein